MKPYLEKQNVSVNVSVVNENGKTVKDANVWLQQTRAFRDSEELHRLSNNYIPYKVRKKTGQDGACLFDSIEMFNIHTLAFPLFFEQARKPLSNLQLTVEAPGYAICKKEF